MLERQKGKVFYIMKKSNKNLICAVVVIAAIVASLTTAAILLLNFWKKRRALEEYNDAFDYDLMDDDYEMYDDYSCGGACDACGGDAGCEDEKVSEAE